MVAGADQRCGIRLSAAATHSHVFWQQVSFLRQRRHASKALLYSALTSALLLLLLYAYNFVGASSLRRQP